MGRVYIGGRDKVPRTNRPARMPPAVTKEFHHCPGCNGLSTWKDGRCRQCGGPDPWAARERQMSPAAPEGRRRPGGASTDLALSASGAPLESPLVTEDTSDA